jgi:hypothetical protein
VAFDTAELPAERRATIERLVEEARFFDQPAAAPPPRGADYKVYTIAVHDGDRTHTVRVADVIANPGLAALVSELESLRMERLRRRPQGG